MSGTEGRPWSHNGVYPLSAKRLIFDSAATDRSESVLYCPFFFLTAIKVCIAQKSLHSHLDVQHSTHRFRRNISRKLKYLTRPSREQLTK